MLKILFLFLWIIPFGASPVHGAIEIYAHGHKFDSIQEYNSWKESSVHIKKDSSSKAHQVNLSDATRRKLYVLSIENGMAGILQNFYQSWGQSALPVTHRISSDQLQGAIQQAVMASTDPKMLISQPGKMRIVDLGVENPGK